MTAPRGASLPLAGRLDGSDAYPDASIPLDHPLLEMPARKAGYVTRGMGETFGDAWRRGDVEFRREILIKSGIRV